jgi:hypothetical protein
MGRTELIVGRSFPAPNFRQINTKQFYTDSYTQRYLY